MPLYTHDSWQATQSMRPPASSSRGIGGQHSQDRECLCPLTNGPFRVNDIMFRLRLPDRQPDMIGSHFEYARVRQILSRKQAQHAGVLAGVAAQPCNVGDDDGSSGSCARRSRLTRPFPLPQLGEEASRHVLLYEYGRSDRVASAWQSKQSIWQLAKTDVPRTADDKVDDPYRCKHWPCRVVGSWG